VDVSNFKLRWAFFFYQTRTPIQLKSMTYKLPKLFLRNVLALGAGAFFIVLASVLLAVKPTTSQDIAQPVKPAVFEAGEDMPGGKATSKKSFKNRNAFSHASGNLGFEKELLFKVGNGLFRKLWVSSPASTKSSDGLGPLFNARSCQRCHLKDGRGHTPHANWPKDDQVSMFLRLSVPPQTSEQKTLLTSGKSGVIPEPTYGSQLQDLAIQGHDGEGRMHIEYTPLPVTLGDGTIVELRKPNYRITHLKYGPLAKDVMISPRVTPPMIGLGLLEAIWEKDILANVESQNRNGDGISGRANWVWSIADDKLKLGRFGWKAGMPSLRQQSAAAFAGDIGLSTSLFPTPFGDCTSEQVFCRKAPHGENDGRPEVRDEMLNLVAFYTQNLAVPKRRTPKAVSVLKGKALFHQIGCASCHRPNYVTGKLAKNMHLEGQTIWPYTDLLLHDMGQGLADNRPESKATGQEWRTPPLWGVGLTKTVNGHEFLLHDGRARSVLEAILWHGGEAQKVTERFKQLSKQEIDWLIEFVRSL